MNIIFNQKSGKIKLQFVFGEMKNIQAPKEWKFDRSKHRELVEFCTLYKRYMYVVESVKTNKKELIDYSVKEYNDQFRNFNDYSNEFIENYRHVFNIHQ